jgi:hypothetical protein
MKTLKATPPTMVLARSTNAAAPLLLRSQVERKALRIYPAGQEV